MKVNLRIIILTILLLFMIDLGFRWWLQDTVQAQGFSYRMPTETSALVKFMQEQIPRGQGINIAFLGDSEMYGSAVPKATETIPYFTYQSLKQLLPGQKLNIYNFSFKGYSPSEIYFYANFLKHSGINLIVYDLSFSWFNRQSLIDHPMVLELSENYPQAEELRKLGIKFPPVDKNTLDFWEFYRQRKLLNYLVLKGDPKKRIKALIKPEVDPLFQPWYQKQWDELIKSKGKFGQIQLSNNPQFRFYQWTLDIWRQQQVPVLIYVTPQNFQLLKRYDKLDWPAFQRGKQVIQKASQGKNISFVDYSQSIEAKYFSDSIHLLAPGNKLVGSLLANDIKRILEADNVVHRD